MPQQKKQKLLAKTTVMLLVSLLKDAQAVTGVGITKTLKLALELLSTKKSYSDLLAQKGSFHFSLDLDKLRED